ncbi:hypothetical protein CK203_022372 [Vitis vinifera]|uniref:Uncharacterized protein n=1 Tax=Vitis vinifera TaxID=29760 RepID=A0A438I9F5_VITVI|nr:hypothetical protein CK203_022372 [Vitis vinifera]
MDLHCAYHQGPGHKTDRCTALRHAVQDLIDQGLVHLGQPSVTTNPLPAHTTRAFPPPADGIHFLDFDEIDDHVHMLSEDNSDLEPIMLDTASVEPLILPHYSVQAPFILIPDVEGVQAPHVDDSQTLDVQYILRGGRVMRQPPPAIVRPVEGTSAPEEIKVETTTFLEGLIHIMTVGRATCIVFSDDDLPPEGSDHTHPLYISVGCSGRRVSSVLLDNGLALNVCPLATAIALEYAPSDFGPSTQTVRAYDNTRREVMGTLEIELLISPTTFVTVFQVLRILTSFNLLLGQPWIHRAGAIPYSLHQKVKFIHDDQITFDEVQTLEMEDFYRDFVAMYFDQHSSTVVLDIMRNMSYLPGMGLGQRQHGPSEFMAFPDHDVPFGSDSFPLRPITIIWRDCARRG